MKRREFLKGFSLGALGIIAASIKIPDIPEVPPPDEGPVNDTAEGAMKWIEEAAADVHWEVSWL